MDSSRTLILSVNTLFLLPQHPASLSVCQLTIALIGSTKHMQIFESASSGSWGALWFLWRGPGSGAPLITYSSGCVITILAIAISPFAQQILYFDQVSTIYTPVRSSVSRSQIYDNGMLDLSPDGFDHSGVQERTAPSRRGLGDI